MDILHYVITARAKIANHQFGLWEGAISAQIIARTSTKTIQLKSDPFFEIPDRQAIFLISDSNPVTHIQRGLGLGHF